MASITAQQLQDLWDLYLSGELKVTHAGGGVTKTIEYASREDLWLAIQRAERRLGKGSGASTAVLGWERDA